MSNTDWKKLKTEFTNGIDLEQLFNCAVIEVNIHPISKPLQFPEVSSSSGRKQYQRVYEIGGITLSSLLGEHCAQDSEFNKFLLHEEEAINQRIRKSFFEYSVSNKTKASHVAYDPQKPWSPFYLLKELIQQIRVNFGPIYKHDYLNRICYRGQNGAYPLLPGALRRQEGSQYPRSFEDVYRRFSLEYQDVNYFPFKGSKNVEQNFVVLKERAKNIALLQHYGLPTNYLDVTYNPFVAMYFMSQSLQNNLNKLKAELKDDTIDEKTDLSPSFYIIFEDEMPDLNKDDGMFISEVPQYIVNHRLTNQKGAFIDFEEILAFVDENTLDKAIQELQKYKIVRISFRLKNNELPHFRGDKHVETSLAADQKLDIYQNLERDIQRKTEEFGYTHDLIFPDLEDVAGNFINDFEYALDTDREEIADDFRDIVGNNITNNADQSASNVWKGLGSLNHRYQRFSRKKIFSNFRRFHSSFRYR